MRKIPVTLPGGESAVGTVIGRDSATDLVALRIEGSERTCCCQGRHGALKVGSLVLAVGRPGRDVAASFGIISAIGKGWRTWQGARIDRVFRLDLAVYDGFWADRSLTPPAPSRRQQLRTRARHPNDTSSGGCRSRSRRADRARSRAAPVRGSRGSTRCARGLPGQAARTVGGCGASHRVGCDGSPAESAGIFVGDVLLEANGKSLSRPTDLLDALAGVPSGNAPSQSSAWRRREIRLGHAE